MKYIPDITRTLLIQRTEAVRSSFNVVEEELMATSFIDHYENVFIQHRLTNIPEDVWPGWRDYMRDRILGEAPLMKAYKTAYPTLDKGFRKYVGPPT